MKKTREEEKREKRGKKGWGNGGIGKWRYGFGLTITGLMIGKYGRGIGNVEANKDEIRRKIKCNVKAL